MSNIYIILIEPEHPGNVGAIARSMKNFDLKNLVLINPKCDHLCSEAIARSMHAKDVLEHTIVAKKIPSYDCIVATTGKIGSDYNLPRVPITPDELSNVIPQNNSVAIVFGREGIGLTNEDIKKCDFTMTIPASLDYPILNLSHAATIVFYELFKNSNKEKTNSHIIMSSAKDKEIIQNQIERILDSIEFTTAEKKETQRVVWKKIFGKAFLTKREAFAVIGLLKKL